MRKQRREGRRVGTKTAIRMPDVVAEVLVLEQVDHRRVGIFGRARRVGPGVVEEFTQEAGEIREVFRGDHAGLEDHQTAIVQEIAQRGTKLVARRPSIETKSGNARADRWLDLGDAHTGRHQRIPKQA